MATDRLKIYNGALLICSDRRLASLTENREPRYLLDDVWNDGGLRYCLEAAQWNFAMRSSHFTYEASITPSFGPSRAFTKPTDWVLTSGVFQDEWMKAPALQYKDEVGYWFADVDDLYIRYVSSDTNYGMNMANWPYTFVDFVKAYFASKIIRKLPGGAEKIEDICHPKKGVLARNLVIAKNKCAMVGPATFPTMGTWVRARQAGLTTLGRDGGSTTQLITQ